MLITLHPKNPNPRDLKKVVGILNEGGVIILPTDTIYAMGGKLGNKKALDKMQKISGKKTGKTDFSLICSDFSEIARFTAPIDKPVFRLMKNNLPGPFTFILKAAGNVTKYFGGSKNTIGIRVPDNEIARQIVTALETPLVVTSIHNTDEILEYMTDPGDIHLKFEHEVDCVVDGGTGGNIPSTVVDCSGGDIVITREGKGKIHE